MNVLTKSFLENIGIHLDDAAYQLFAEHFDSTLNNRIVDSIVDNLSDDQLEDFSRVQTGNNEDEMWTWLQVNIPELGEIVQDEIDILLGEIAENSEQINEPTS